MISVAIDGPSGAGKSSLAKRLAADMGFTYVDTGAMYRSIGLYAVRQGKDPHDAAAVEALLPQIHLDTKLEEGTQHFYLNGEDVSSAIRAEEIGMAASAVAAIPAVRTFAGCPTHFGRQPRCADGWPRYRHCGAAQRNGKNLPDCHPGSPRRAPL